MTISPDFFIPGFERKDLDGGTLFVRWRKAPPDILLLIRTSDNRYQYAAQNGTSATRGAVSSLRLLEIFCKRFFA